jgi:hypothetical protein
MSHGASYDSPRMLNKEFKPWEYLLQKTILYAATHVTRWHWRGSPDGVLPDGFDPQSIASQAIADFLRESPTVGAIPPVCPSNVQFQIDDIQRDLERRVRRHVNRLYHRSENRLLRNEPDLIPHTLDDGEAVSVIDLIPVPLSR